MQRIMGIFGQFKWAGIAGLLSEKNKPYKMQWAKDNIVGPCCLKLIFVYTRNKRFKLLSNCNLQR